MNIKIATSEDIFTLLKGPLGYTPKLLEDEAFRRALNFITNEVVSEMDRYGYVMLVDTDR